MSFLDSLLLFYILFSMKNVIFVAVVTFILKRGRESNISQTIASILKLLLLLFFFANWQILGL